MIYCDVIVQSLSPAFRNGLTYACLDGDLRPGQLISVPLQGKDTEGVVICTHRRRPRGTYVVRPIRKVLSRTPLLPGAQLETLLWIAENEHCSLRQALSVSMPARGKWSSFLPLHEAAPPVPRSMKTSSQLLIASYADRRKEYIEAIRDTISAGGSAILIVPFQKRAEEWTQLLRQELRWQVALFTSALPGRKRRDCFKRCLEGDARIVVGTRSALFLPIQNLELIIIDDEHDPLYKADRTPRYHAREVARVLAAKAGAKLILSSSSPSVESWWGFRRKTYSMKHRAAGKLPRVSIIDLTDAPCSPYPLSLSLLSFLERAHQGGKSIVVYLNDRRGLAEAESILRKRFPHARIHFGTSSIFSLPMDSGFDVAVALNADIGSNIPNFRASEWTFHRLVSLRSLARDHVIIQTHRPNAPEIRAAATGDIAAFLDGELAERRRAGYPPFQSMTRLVVKGKNSEQRASRLVAVLKEKGIPATATSPRQGALWQVFLRSNDPHAVLSRLDLKDVSIDREPYEW